MSKKSELRATVKLIKSHLKNLGKATLTQEEVYEYLDSIKVEVPDDDMDIMLELLLEENILADDFDDGDASFVNSDDIMDEVDAEKSMNKDDQSKGYDDGYSSKMQLKSNETEELEDDSDYSKLIRNYSDNSYDSYEDESEEFMVMDDDYHDSSYDEDDEDDEIVYKTDDKDQVTAKAKRGRKPKTKLNLDTLELEDFSAEEIDLSANLSVKKEDLKNKLTETNDIVKWYMRWIGKYGKLLQPEEEFELAYWNG